MHIYSVVIEGVGKTGKIRRFFESKDDARTFADNRVREESNAGNSNVRAHAVKRLKVRTDDGTFGG